MLNRGEKWRCLNPMCCAEIVVTESSRKKDVTNPLCGCGTVMKRDYQKPAARTIVMTAKELVGATRTEC